MSRALTRIGGTLQQANRRQALREGTCFFCGYSLKDHPLWNGQIKIDRHHRLCKFLEPIYPIVNGTAYPDNQDNLYWAGARCHWTFHTELAYRASEAEIQIVDRIAKRWAESPSYKLTQPERKGLRAFLSSFGRQMEACNYGELALESPAQI